MKIIVAPDSFKGVLSASEAAAAIAQGLQSVLPHAQIELLPLADGGEGTVEALVQATGGRQESVTVHDPLGRIIQAQFGILGDGHTAVIEMAAASGLPLLRPTERNPLRTSTYGTGELLQAALEAGVDKIIFGLGGSATVDGGAGLAQALGIKLLDSQGQPLPPGGGALHQLERIEMQERDQRLERVLIEVACDVTNPLLGPQGAAQVYGPQKGATPEMVTQLEENLTHLAQCWEQQLGCEVTQLPGAGAAGGLGAGLVAFCGAQLRSGVEVIFQALNLPERLQGATVAITGEGCLDGQTLHGKAPLGLAKQAQRLNIPVIALNGVLGEQAYTLLEHGISACFASLPRSLTAEQIQRTGRYNLTKLAEQIARVMLLGNLIDGLLPTVAQS